MNYNKIKIIFNILAVIADVITIVMFLVFFI